jgi:hypothetical protein
MQVTARVLVVGYFLGLRSHGKSGVVAQGLRSGPAALPAVRVLAAPHTR